MTSPLLPHLPPDPAFDQCFKWLEISVVANIVLGISKAVDLAEWAIEKWRARRDPV